jgi:hypothetical protein
MGIRPSRCVMKILAKIASVNSDSFRTKRRTGHRTQFVSLLRDASMACLVAVPTSRQVSRPRRQLSGATLPTIHGRVNNGLLC